MNQNLVIRSVRASDLSAILEIAGETGPGFSLPKNAKVLTDKIAHSMDSFAEKIDPQERYYFFVMENTSNHEIAGTACIVSCLGRQWPFYKYKISTLVQVSHAIHQSRSHQILQWVSDHEGATELCALSLKPAYRGEGRGTFLSRSRCLFISEFPKLFSERVVADMRGVSDKDAVSPFWEALGRRFIDMTYEEASYLKATEGSQFMIDLLPHDPIYVDLLSESAKNIIGKTHENTTPALHVLEKEGFQFFNYIDLFDAGPTIEMRKDSLRTVRESQSARMIACKESLSGDRIWLMSNTNLDFRAAVGSIEFVREGEVILETALANVLNVKVGDRIRYALLK